MNSSRLCSEFIRPDAPDQAGLAPEIRGRLALALRCAQQAGASTLRWFARAAGANSGSGTGSESGVADSPDAGLGTELKADGSPVTLADREAETLLRDLIAAAYPDDGILGEEYPEKVGGSPYRWVIDPIDGTKSFVHGVPLYGTLVAVEVVDARGGAESPRSVIGVIEMPALGERVYAARGLGAWHEGRVAAGMSVLARVSRTHELKDALVCVTAPKFFQQEGRAGLLDELVRRAGAVRGWSDCYAHVLVATGRADAVVEPVMKPWDSAASQVIIEEAGGRFTDLSGRETAHGPTALLSNGLLHAELLSFAALRPS